MSIDIQIWPLNNFLFSYFYISVKFFITIRLLHNFFLNLITNTISNSVFFFYIYVLELKEIKISNVFVFLYFYFVFKK